MMPTLEYLLLILIVREISCYDTSLPDFDAMREDILKAKARHRVKRVINQYVRLDNKRICSALHFFIYFIAVVVPAILGLIMAIAVWSSLVRQIDSIVKAPPDGVKMPPLANKPPGFYVPLHRRPLIYLQLMKEKCCGKKGTYQENVLRRRKRKKSTKPDDKKKDEKKESKTK